MGEVERMLKGIDLVSPGRVKKARPLISDEVYEKSLSLPIEHFRSLDEVYFFVIRGGQSYGLQIWEDGKFICSCQYGLSVDYHVCSHKVAALHAIEVLRGKDYVHELIFKFLLLEETRYTWRPGKPLHKTTPSPVGKVT